MAGNRKSGFAKTNSIGMQSALVRMNPHAKTTMSIPTSRRDKMTTTAEMTVTSIKADNTTITIIPRIIEVGKPNHGHTTAIGSLATSNHVTKK